MGVKVSVTFRDASGSKVPLVALTVKTSFPVSSPVHVRRLFPPLVMVSGRVSLSRLITFPNTILPDSSMMRDSAMPVPVRLMVSDPLVLSLVIVSVLS